MKKENISWKGKLKNRKKHRKKEMVRPTAVCRAAERQTSTCTSRLSAIKEPPLPHAATTIRTSSLFFAGNICVTHVAKLLSKIQRLTTSSGPGRSYSILRHEVLPKTASIWLTLFWLWRMWVIQDFRWSMSKIISWTRKLFEDLSFPLFSQDVETLVSLFQSLFASYSVAKQVMPPHVWQPTLLLEH